MNVPKHIPVLLKEVLSVLNPHDNGIYLDGTFGAGGHTKAILEAAKTQVIAMDTDPFAKERSMILQSEYPHRFSFIDLNFKYLNQISQDGLDGMLFDLGVSSFQLDESERGFSFQSEGPVDMRLNPRTGISAASFLEEASPEALTKAIRDYGEEPAWKRVVSAIMNARGSKALQSTLQLGQLIAHAVGYKPQKGPKKPIHPATKSFQGIRIMVNDELGAIEAMLPVAFSKLKLGGILAIISFHSLEDRIIKRFFKKVAGLPESRFDNAPQCSRTAYGKIITKNAIQASLEEQAINRRSRSAKLRAIQKTKNILL